MKKIKPRYSFIILLIAINLQVLMAQNVSNVIAKHVDGKVLVNYDLETTVPAYFVELLFSKDGGITFSDPLKKVSGDVNNVNSGSGKRIVWDAENEIGYFEGNMIFRVIAEARSVKMPDILETEKFSLEVKKLEARNSKLFVTAILVPKIDTWLKISKSSSGLINSVGANQRPSSVVFKSSNSAEINGVTNLPIELEMVYDNYSADMTLVPRLYIYISTGYSSKENLFGNVPVFKEN